MNADQIKKDPAAFLEAEIKAYIANSPNNIMPDFPGEHMWDEPLVGFANGDDPLFTEYKKIIGDFHATPREVLEMNLKKKALGYYNHENISVISYFLPSTKLIRESMRKEREICSLRWNRARWFGQECNFRLQRHLVALLEDLGYHAIAPEQEAWFEIKREGPWAPASSWSQRHVAYVTGLGTFSINDSFITAKGSAGRVGSIVCDIPIVPSTRVAKDYRENCLLARERTCGTCIKRCPVGAISDKGHDKMKCYVYLSAGMPQRVKEQGRTENFVGSYIGCGFCQTGVPCEDRIPASMKKSDQSLI
jgi:epoxyqueuosine reductase